MITVRFPTGFSIQYNEMNHIKWGTDCAHLYKNSTATGWSVTVPKECVIEFVAPCRTYNPITTDSDKVQAEVQLLAKEVRSLKRKLAKVSQ